jgi:hypothetical protein
MEILKSSIWQPEAEKTMGLRQSDYVTIYVGADGGSLKML